MDDNTTPVDPQISQEEPAVAPAAVINEDQNARLSIKKQAIDALVPLLDNLQEAPERKFEMIMTAVRSSDDDNLLRKALDVANLIEDPTAKAEALIDVLNEASFQEQDS